MGPAQLRAELVERLNIIGIRATTDPAKLNPPDIAVLVEAVDLTASLGGCAWQSSITVWLCAPASTAAEALTKLEERLVDVAATIGATSARHTTRSQGNTQWPAYELTVSTTVTWEKQTP